MELSTKLRYNKYIFEEHASSLFLIKLLICGQKSGSAMQRLLEYQLKLMFGIINNWVMGHSYATSSPAQRSTVIICSN